MTTLEIDYAKCIVYLYPNAEWALNGNDYNSLEWLSDEAKPTEAEIIAAWPQAKKLFEAKYAARVTAKETAQSKLAALGLTADDLKALGL
jgi:hypothetical protein